MRQVAVLPRLDAWLARLVGPANVDATVAALATVDGGDSTPAEIERCRRTGESLRDGCWVEEPAGSEPHPIGGAGPWQAVDEIFSPRSSYSRVVTTPTHGDLVDLVGRETEFAAARRLLEAVTGGASATLLIEGEAGIGKTQLVERIVGEARGWGMWIHRGGARPRDQSHNFSGSSCHSDPGGVVEAFGA
ncbi:MAG: ATP-binding protein [Actinomycetota bacterium]|nr:ATP-binding protein [Actinomycetota bacterium]